MGFNVFLVLSQGGHVVLSQILNGEVKKIFFQLKATKNHHQLRESVSKCVGINFLNQSSEKFVFYSNEVPYSFGLVANVIFLS